MAALACSRVTIEGTTIPAGIQVKAITEREEEEIVTPLIDGKYLHVLTLLVQSRVIISLFEAGHCSEQGM
jgi:hypothetical protein